MRVQKVIIIGTDTINSNRKFCVVKKGLFHRTVEGVSRALHKGLLDKEGYIYGNYKIVTLCPKTSKCFVEAPDIENFDIIFEHFKKNGEVIAKYSGSVVFKTI